MLIETEARTQNKFPPIKGKSTKENNNDYHEPYP